MADKTLERIEATQAVIESLLREGVRFDVDLDSRFPKIVLLAIAEDNGFTGRGKSGRSS